MSFFTKILTQAAATPPSTSGSTDATSTDAAIAAPPPATSGGSSYAAQVAERRRQQDAERAQVNGGDSFMGMPNPYGAPMPDVQQNSWWDPESGGMSQMSPTYAPGVYDPSQSLAVNLGNAGFGDNSAGGNLHPTFRSAIETAYGWNRMQEHGNAFDYGGQEAFDLIMNADPQRAAQDPLGYANELLVEAGVIPRGFKDVNELSAVNLSLPGHNSTDWEWMETAVPMALGVMSGGALGPAFSGMLGTTGGAMAGAGLGNFGMATMMGAPIEDALRAGAMSGLGAGIPGMAPMFGGGPLGATIASGLGSAGMGVLSGQDLEDAIKQGLMAAGTTGAIKYGTPYINDLAGGAQDWLAGAEAPEFDMSAVEDGFDIGEGQQGMLPIRSTIGGMNTDPFTGLTSSSPTMTSFTDESGLLTETAPPDYDWQTDPNGTFATRMALGGMSEFDADLADEDEANRATLEAGDALTNEEEPLVTEQDVAKAVKVGKALVEMFGEEPSGPVRQEGQSDDEYAADLAEYIEVDLSPETMAELGLEPGTPAYYEHIMNEADAIIETMVGGLEGEELSAALREMTKEEIAKLQRAVYVRGQMGSMVQAGSAQIDPVTGEAVQVGVEGGGPIDNPGLGAYQSGLARDVQGLTSLEDIYALLGRNFDPYGMQRAADARSALARKSETQDDELRLRRRGMLSR